MPAQLITKEEIIDLKNCFACAKAALENHKFYQRNAKDASECYRSVVICLFEFTSAILGVGWSTKPYKWLLEKIKTIRNSPEFRNLLEKYQVWYPGNEEFRDNFAEAIASDIDFYAWFISSPEADGYKQYINNNISDKQANKYLDRYIKLVEEHLDGCPHTREQFKYWKIIFRENNKFHKALFNK